MEHNLEHERKNWSKFSAENWLDNTKQIEIEIARFIFHDKLCGYSNSNNVLIFVSISEFQVRFHFSRSDPEKKSVREIKTLVRQKIKKGGRELGD